MPNGATFKVPRLYKAAAKVISVVSEENGNLEQLVQLYNGKTNTKALSALVSKTLDNEGLLDKIIQNSEILVKEANADPWLFRILITELLLGKQRLPIGSKPVQTVLAYGPTLRTEFLRATGKLHKTQKKIKSEPGIKEVDPECKQDSSTHNKTHVFGKRNDKKQELDSTMHSNSWCAEAQDCIKLEEDEDVQSKHTKQPKSKKKKLNKKQLPSEQISGVKIKQDSSTHNKTRVFGKRNDKKQELDSTMHSNSWCSEAQDYIKLEEDEDIQSKHPKQPKSKKKKLNKKQLPSEQISGVKIKKRKHNMSTCESTHKKHKVDSPISVNKSRYFE